MSRPVQNTSDVVTNARDLAAEQAKVPLGERVAATEQKADTERWPEVKLSRGPKSDRLRFAPSTPPPGYEASWELLTETYVPASALEKEKAEREAVACEFERLGAMASAPTHTAIWNRAADMARRGSNGGGGPSAPRSPETTGDLLRKNRARERSTNSTALADKPDQEEATQ